MTRVLVVGVGSMGFAHAKACASLAGNEIIGLVARDWRKWQPVARHFSEVPLFNDFYTALHKTKPEAVIISSFTDTHAPYAIKAMEAGADVFVEKPLATNIRDAGLAIATARKYGRKLCVGYILRHHAMWQKFVQCAKTLGTPLHVTMTSNQHSTGDDWHHHKNILEPGLSPLVDCGIHHADLMIQLGCGEVADLKARGTKTNSEVSVENNINMKISYSDGSTLDFESGFGPEIDPEKPVVKMAEGPEGTVNITPQNSVIHNGQEHTFGPETYDKSIVSQQKHFFEVIKEDIDLEEHYKAVALSMATVLIAEQEMIKY